MLGASDRRDDRLGVDVAHQRDLALDVLGNLPIAAAHDGVRGDADAAQGGHRVLRRFGLQFTRGREVRHERDVQEEAVVAADVVTHLPRRLEERQGLDVADGPADLGDDDMRAQARRPARARPCPDASLDLVGDVRDDLDGVAEVFAATLLGDHGRIDLTGRHVGRPDEVGVEEALVVPDVQVGLRAVLGDEDLAVLERVHRAGVDVQVRVELLHRHSKAAGLEQATEAAGRQALAQ